MSCQSKKKSLFYGIYVLVVGVFVFGVVSPRIVHAAVLDWKCDPSGSQPCFILPTANATEKKDACFDKAVSTLWGAPSNTGNAKVLKEGDRFYLEIPIGNTSTVEPTFSCSNCGVAGTGYKFYADSLTNGILEIPLVETTILDKRSAQGPSPYYYGRFLISATVTTTPGNTETIYANLCVAVQKPTQEASTQPTTKAPVVDIKSTFPSITDLNPLRTTSVPTLFGRAIKILLGVLGSIAIVLFMYGGVMWMTSMGNADRADKGLKTIVWGSMGIFVIFSSYAVVQFILGSFK